MVQLLHSVLKHFALWSFYSNLKIIINIHSDVTEAIPNTK